MYTVNGLDLNTSQIGEFEKIYQLSLEDLLNPQAPPPDPIYESVDSFWSQTSEYRHEIKYSGRYFSVNDVNQVTVDPDGTTNYNRYELNTVTISGDGVRTWVESRQKQRGNPWFEPVDRRNETNSQKKLAD